jgi:cytochrome b involved in lipid metabolism
MPTYTLEEVAEHNTPEDCWIVIDGGVYDITEWHMEHPGGSDILMENGGADASSMFDAIGHSEEAIDTREEYRIGDLVPAKQITKARL